MQRKQRAEEFDIITFGGQSNDHQIEVSKNESKKKWTRSPQKYEDDQSNIHRVTTYTHLLRTTIKCLFNCQIVEPNQKFNSWHKTKHSWICMFSNVNHKSFFSFREIRFSNKSAYSSSSRMEQVKTLVDAYIYHVDHHQNMDWF